MSAGVHPQNLVKTRVCGRCHLEYTEEAWESLALAQRLEPPEVRRLALNWPADVCVEARRCSRCEAMVVAKRRWPAPTDRAREPR